MPDLFGDEPEQETIVAIKPTRRDANRATIRVGRGGSKAGGGSSASGRPKARVVATLTSRGIAELGLRVGQVWTDELAERVRQATGLDKAMRAAMNRLSRRAMSRWMLAEKLRGLGHEPGVIDRVLERLVELELLDDEQFGRALVCEVMARKAAGPALLKQKLYQKGIRGSLADRLIAEATADDDAQRGAVTELARKRLATMRHLDAATRKRRLYGQLARRGFDPDMIRVAMASAERDAAGEA